MFFSFPLVRKGGCHTLALCRSVEISFGFAVRSGDGRQHFRPDHSASLSRSSHVSQRQRDVGHPPVGTPPFSERRISVRMDVPVVFESIQVAPSGRGLRGIAVTLHEVAEALRCILVLTDGGL